LNHHSQNAGQPELVWNGLVDSVAGLLAMVKMIYDGITLGKDFAKNIEKYLPALLEQFDEAVQAIRNISFSDTAKYIHTKLKQINLTFSGCLFLFYRLCLRFYHFADY